MNSFPFNLQEIKKQNELYKRMKIDSIKKLFKCKIKESFLLSVYNSIEKEPDNFQTILTYYPDLYNLEYSNIVTGGDNIDLDICSNITGIHNFNMICISDEDKGKKQNSQKYKEELKKEVINQIKVRELGSALFRRRKIFGKEDYMFYPPVYYLHVLILYLLKILIQYNQQNLGKDKKEVLMIDFLLIILNKAKGIMAIIDYNNLDSGYPILRGIIELYITYLVLQYSKCDLEEYEKFDEYKINYYAKHKFSKEFEEKYESKKDNTINKIDFLHYGWIDSIFEMGYFRQESQTYKLNDLIELVNGLIYKNRKIKNYCADLKWHYRNCHIFTHGNVIDLKYPIIHIMDLCTGLGNVILGVADEIKRFTKIENYNGLDIVMITKELVDELKKKKSSLTTE